MSDNYSTTKVLYEAKYYSLLQSLPCIVYTLDESCKITEVNSAIKTVLYYDVEEVIDLQFDKLISTESIEKYNRDRKQNVVNTLNEKAIEKVYRYEIVLIDKKGHKKTFELFENLLFDDSKGIINTFGIAFDITDRKYLEEELGKKQVELIRKNDELENTLDVLEQTQLQLFQTEKLNSLGNIVAGVAHEVNSPIGCISCNNDVIMKCIHKIRSMTEDKSENLEEYLSIIENVSLVTNKACKKVKEIISNLRSFVRLDEAELQKADILKGIDDTVKMISYQVKNNIEIENRCSDIPEITCHPNQINQVFMNLLINAVQSINHSGKIIIESRNKQDYIEISFTDNGCGIKSEHFNKIFEPGFTTKKAGEGTGLGLCITKQIIEAHGGHIDVRSKENEGSTFCISLPIRYNIDEK